MEVVEGEKGKRRILKLFCPSLSKIIQITARDDQKLDLGSISRAFGLDPNTMKLNGHFISRGVDFIASSVTWRSLIGFFSARGLSTGAADSDALLVDGKFPKIGSKRLHHIEDIGDGIVNNVKEQGYFREKKRRQHEHCNKEKAEVINLDLTKRATGTNEFDSCCLQRKWLLGNESEIKRTRSDEAVSGFEERKGSISTSRGFSCSFINQNMKRTRDDEMVAATPLKKIR